MAIWRYVLTTRNGVALGELANATGRTLNKTLNGVDTAGFTLPMADPLAREIVRVDATTREAGEHLLKVYRQDGGAPQLVFHGPVVDAEAVYTGVGGTVQVNAASPMWTLQHRLAAKDAIGQPRTPKARTGKRAQIAVDLLAAANGEGKTGVATPASIPDTNEVALDDIGYRPLAELITELSRGQLGAQAADGFDFVIEPMEWSSEQIGTLRIGAYISDPRNINAVLIGRELDDVVFELGPGTRGSAVSARHAITRGGLANIVHHVPGENEVVIGADNSPSITARGRHEAVLTEDITDVPTRQKLVDLHVAVRRVPRRVITFEAAPEEQSVNVPRAYGEFGIGDSIWLRAVDSAGQVALQEMVRVYGIATSIDDASGVGRHEFTVVAE